MKPLSVNRKSAIIELARQGEDGEKENARKLCAKYGLDWQGADPGPLKSRTSRNTYTSSRPKPRKPDNIKEWQRIDYKPTYRVGLIVRLGANALGVIPLFDTLAEKYTIDVINSVIKTNRIFRPCCRFEFSYLTFWGTEKQKEEVEAIIHVGLMDYILKLYSVYIDCSPHVFDNSNNGEQGNSPESPPDSESVYKKSSTFGMDEGLYKLWERDYKHRKAGS